MLRKYRIIRDRIPSMMERDIRTVSADEVPPCPSLVQLLIELNGSMK